MRHHCKHLRANLGPLDIDGEVWRGYLKCRYCYFKATRLVQLAGLVAYSIRRRYEKGEHQFLASIESDFTRAAYYTGLFTTNPPIRHVHARHAAANRDNRISN